MSINVIIFGATGMIGQGVMHSCIAHPGVRSVLAVTRRPLTITHPKLKVIVMEVFEEFYALAQDFRDYDTCFFCLGVSSVGMEEGAYHEITYTLTEKVAESLLHTANPFTFCYISGAGTDSTEKGRVMWARVKGQIENRLLGMPFKHAYMFRPGFIQPLRGIRSRTPWYNILYAFSKPVYWLLRPFTILVTDTDAIGHAMINAAIYGSNKRILGTGAINRLAGRFR